VIPAIQPNYVPQNKEAAGNLNFIRVVVADGRATFRNALRTHLQAETDLTIVGEASDAKTVLALTRELNPDVVLIDVALFYSLNGRAGTQPAFRTLVTVPNLDPADIIKAFLQGARAVVPKPSPSHIWSESIHAVGAGQYWLVNESIAVLVQALQDHFPREAEPKFRNDYRLTPRELEIMERIAQGLSNKEIGQAFAIREKTVKHHLTSIFTKVGVSSRLELALFALSHRSREAPPVRDATLANLEASLPATPGK
jgi:DNA-binding NarL/FixJ family response regulator